MKRYLPCASCQRGAMRITKSNQNDARGLAEMARTGWYREAAVKGRRAGKPLRCWRGQYQERSSFAERSGRALPLPGVVDHTFRFGRSNRTGQGTAARKYVANPVLQRAWRRPCAPVGRTGPCRALFRAPTQTAHLIVEVSPQIHQLGSRRLSFVVTIDDPRRFRHSADLRAYVGLTPRRHQSGATDRTGSIAKRGDHQIRTYLFEAANVLLTALKRSAASRPNASAPKKRRLPSRAKWLSSPCHLNRRHRVPGRDAHRMNQS